jgi:hypothetical protein
MKTLVIKFDAYAGKDYHYLVDDTAKVSVGDNVVVHNGSEYRVVKVIDIKAGASARATKTVVTILNGDVFAEYQEANKRVAEQRDLFARLDQLLAQESENNKYRLLAQGNSEAAEILSKLGIK